MSYCPHMFRYERFVSREVKIGDVPLGHLNPIRVQSMTTTDTLNTIATVEQSIRMIEAGCEYVRITAPSIKEAKNLANIKAELKKRGYQTPLIADIHFTPNAAEHAARIVEKVRVNPGNYADKKKFEFIEYNDAQYQEELDRIRERFTPLVKICKEYGTAMRIGTNHGSLSDRIMSRYGDTPLGMVESALEFLHICRDENYHNIVLSMKASNPLVMVQAYRLLVSKMIEEKMNYPLHLGVTEAGDGEDGRIKSAVGIGALLEDGLGDTIRVSLTEDPEFEIPVALNLVSRYAQRKKHLEIPHADQINTIAALPYSPYEFNKRPSTEVLNIGASNTPIVVSDISGLKKITPASLFAMGYQYSVPLDKWNLNDQACDYLFSGDQEISFEIPGTLGIIQNYSTWKNNPGKERHYPLHQFNNLTDVQFHPQLNFVQCNSDQILSSQFQLSENINGLVLVLNANSTHAMAELRSAFIHLNEKNCSAPVIFQRDFSDHNNDTFTLYASTDVGALFLDGLGDGVWLKGNMGHALINRTAFGILQATRSRISKTEYISCPSCGRTLFDLQETTAKIRARTGHLKGVKIGIMGCIVNGPGEMADADYGYVGTGVGKITLYKGKEVVQRNIDENEAVDELIGLIKQHGDWIEAKETSVENY